MQTMNRRETDIRTRLRRRGWPLLLLAALPVSGAGCANWGYDRVQIGMTLQECERQLAEESYQRTTLGFCNLDPDRKNAAQTIVILLARNGRVAGKLRAAASAKAEWSGTRPGYRLTGEIDPRAADLDAAGPFDTLRAITLDLLSQDEASVVQHVYFKTAAGLARLMERWPHMEPAASAYPQLTEPLEQIPAGGRARISVDRRGVYSFEYEQDQPEQN